MNKILIPFVLLLLLLSTVGCGDNTPIDLEGYQEIIPKSETSLQEDLSSLTVYSKIEEISSLPEKVENAILSGSAIGGVTKYFCFQSGLEFYIHDTITEKYYKGVLELPSNYTNGEIISLFAGAGSGEIEILLKAKFEGKTVYPGLILYNYSDNGEFITNRHQFTAYINDEERLIERGIIKKESPSE